MTKIATMTKSGKKQNNRVLKNVTADDFKT